MEIIQWNLLHSLPDSEIGREEGAKGRNGDGNDVSPPDNGHEKGQDREVRQGADQHDDGSNCLV